MSQIVQVGNEILRISPKNPCHIEYSYNGGRSWLSRYIGTVAGPFKDLQTVGTQLVALSAKGIFYSKDQGRTWLLKSR
ncbi:hypothetical protein [Candidatus Avelusimicrobium fimicolum]|uniref:hypothetical protein n=1 Tax=Candidatus Avelusimicrobium fimicolum TaxID=3416216 RepID=UPI003D0980C2